MDTLRSAEINESDLTTKGLIAEICESAIVERWDELSPKPFERQPPFTVVDAVRTPPARVSGAVSVSVVPSAFHFCNVMDLAALNSALQECVDRKRAKNQWGDTSNQKWLAIVLDSSQAADQLVGDAFELGDSPPDFSELIWQESTKCGLSPFMTKSWQSCDSCIRPQIGTVESAYRSTSGLIPTDGWALGAICRNHLR